MAFICINIKSFVVYFFNTIICENFIKMKRILFINTNSDIGGSSKWTKEQIEVCSKEFDCYLATNKKGWLSTKSNINRVLFSHLIQSRFSIRYLLLLSNYVRENKINIIVASSANAGVYSRLLKLFNYKIRVVYVTHGWSAIYNGKRLKYLYILIEKFLSKLSDSILCISEYDYQSAIKIIGINKGKLKKIPNSIFPILGTKKIHNNRIKILSIARFTPPKRMDLLINSVKNIDIELHFIGDGELRAALERDAPDNVFFHGEIEDFSNFSDFDIFCLISDSEGLPLSAIEAMSCGMSLLLSNVGGCPELVLDNGILVENNVADIRNAIIQISSQIDTYGIESKTLFENRYNLVNNQNEYLSYYQDI